MKKTLLIFLFAFSVCLLGAEEVLSLSFKGAKTVFNPTSAVSEINTDGVELSSDGASFNGHSTYQFKSSLSQFSAKKFKAITVRVKFKFDKLNGKQTLILKNKSYEIIYEDGAFTSRVYPTEKVALGFPLEAKLKAGEVYDIFLRYVAKGRADTLLYNSNGDLIAFSKPWTTSHHLYNDNDKATVLGSGFKGKIIEMKIYDQYLTRGKISSLLSCHEFFKSNVKRPVKSISEKAKYYYFNDFEEKSDAFMWTNYGKPYNVNFDGLSSEEVFSGKKSYKLDVTFPQVGRYIWAFNIPETALFKGSYMFAYMMFGKASTAHASLGICTQIIAGEKRATGFTKHSPHLKTTNGKWRKIEYGNDKYTKFELFAGSMLDLGYLNFDPAYVDKNDLIACPEKIIIDISVRKPGERLVLYLDELAFGNSKKEMTRLASGIFDVKQKLIDKRVAARADQIENGLTKAQKQIKSASKNTHNRFIFNALNADIKKLCKLLKATKKGEINFDAVEPLFSRITHTCDNLSKIDATLTDDAPLITYNIPNITSENFWILPSDTLIPGNVSDVFELRACRGEYEPVSLLIKPLRDINKLAIKTSDLVGLGGKRIKAANIDVKYVKVWYQAGGSGKSIRFGKGSLLTPELLLNDPELVKVDYKKKKNSLKLTFPDKTEYVDISNPRKIERMAYKNSEYPVKDATKLQPIDLKKDNNQQIWITVHIPEEAQSGLYEGTIVLKAGERVVGSVKLKVEVLPFTLLEPYYIASIDYHGDLTRKGTIGSYEKNRIQMLAELKNMRAHGLTNIQHYFRVNKKSLKNVAELRKLAGFSNDVLFLKGHGINYLSENNAYIEQSRKRVRKIIDIARKLGVGEVYFYGRDEVTGHTLRKERKSWTATREEGGKIFVAGQRDNSEFMADIQDIYIKAGWPDNEVSKKIHAYKHKIFMYATPQVGVEDPKIYRRNYGLVMYKYGYDGIGNNAYQHTFGTTWNDFDHNLYRAHTFAYPTINGVVDTIAWEGYREAIDDVRYISTLEAALKKAQLLPPKTQTLALKKSIKAAEKFLAKIKNSSMVESTNLDKIKNIIIEHIIALED